MSVEKLQRTLWRLRSKYPGRDSFTNQQLRWAIMWECGTDPKTYKHNRAALSRLGWIKVRGRSRVSLTGNDLSEA